MQSNVDITRLYGIYDVKKILTGRRMMLNDVTIFRPGPVTGVITVRESRSGISVN